MSLKEELQAIDGNELVKVAKASLDKISVSSQEITYIFDTIRTEYPAFRDLLNYLMHRYNYEASNPEQAAALAGAGAVVMSIFELVEEQEMKERFPDIFES